MPLPLGILIVAAACAEPGGRAPAPFVQEGPGFYQELSWAPDGGSLLVSVLEITDAEPGWAYRIWRVDLAGGDPSPLTDGPRDYWTSWAPDGRRIAFAALGEDGALDIFSTDAAGTDRRRLTSHEGDDTQPAWSPDGERIAFISYRDGDAAPWLMNADGTGPRLLVRPAGEAQNPAWSPDGTRLAYYQTDADGNHHVVVLGADGSDPRPVAVGVWPSWTPDGGGLLYSSEGGLYRVPATGGAPELVIAGDVVAGELSPDGTRLAYIAQEGGAVSLMVSGASGEDARTLMTRPAPDW